MKKLKLIVAIIAILLFSNVLFAGNPNVETADDICNVMVMNMHNDVSLTTAQKEVMKKIAKIYADKLIEARSMSNKDDSYALMKTATDNYLVTLDSLLTPDQKDLKEKKQKNMTSSHITKPKSIN